MIGFVHIKRAYSVWKQQSGGVTAYKDPEVVGALEAFVTLKTLLELWKLALVQIQQSPVLWGLCLGGIEHSCGVDGSSSSGPKQVVVGQL